jgi:hypothetical protein
MDGPRPDKGPGTRGQPVIARPRPLLPARPPTRPRGTLIAVAPITGVAQVVAATPEVARPLGYDLDRSFEALDSDPGRLTGRVWVTPATRLARPGDQADVLQPLDRLAA